MRKSFALLPVVLLLAANPALAADINLNAAVSDSCSVNVGSAGTMTVSASNTLLGSEESGGSAASFTVTSSGTAPLVSFAAANLVSTPAGWTQSGTDEVKFSSTGGASQAYTATASSYQMQALMDSFTVHGRVNDNNGFAAGNYVLRTVVTCGVE